MDKDDVIKFIDGKVFYYSDYINFLYKQLELKDNIIKEVREYIESNPLVYIGDTDVKVEDILYQEKNIEDTKFFKTLFEILDKENK